MPSIQTSLAIPVPFWVGHTLPSRRNPGTRAVSYTHLTLPTNREV